jgi:hypothetical protein
MCSILIVEHTQIELSSCPILFQKEKIDHMLRIVLRNLLLFAFAFDSLKLEPNV